MRLEGLPGFQQRLQAGKNTWPSIGAGSKPQDLPSHVGHGLAIGSLAHPGEQATRLKVRLKLSAREDHAVRLPRRKAFPHLVGGGGNVEDKFQWCLDLGGWATD